MDIVCTSENELRAYAQSFVQSLTPLEDGATVIALAGDLGSGKTTFTKYCAEAFGVEDVVTSPTFVLQKKYHLNNQQYDVLIHMDMYRIEDEKEVEVLDWDEMLHNPQNVLFIEWPERVQERIPASALRFAFETINNTTRKITRT